jgi:hypothetical protein
MDSREGVAMPSALDRLLALDRALDDVRSAERALGGRGELASWRGPAHAAFVRAFDEIPPLLRSAGAALERDRARALLALLEHGGGAW